MGLFVFPLVLCLIVDWFGDIDSSNYGQMITVVSVAVWMLCVASGVIGVGRCLAWRRGAHGGVDAVLLGMLNAGPVAMACFLIFMDWYSGGLAY